MSLSPLAWVSWASLGGFWVWVSPMAWVSWAYIRHTRWLHGLNVRAFLSTPVSLASFGTRYDGIKLQICLNTANWLRLGMFVFFIPAAWQGKPAFPSLFLDNFPHPLWHVCGAS